MELESKDEEEIKRYLIGDPSDSDFERIENRMLTDQDYLQQVELVEIELIDEYLSGMFSAKEREKFENKFLSNPDGIENLKLSIALRKLAQEKGSELLRQYVGDSSRKHSVWDHLPPKLSARRYILAAAIIIFALLLPLSFFRIFQLQRQVAQLSAQLSPGTEEDAQEQLAQDHAEIEQLKESLQSEQDKRRKLEQRLAALGDSDKPPNSNTSIPDPSSRLAAIILTPGTIRSSQERKRVVIELSTKSVQIHLIPRGEDYDNYKVDLQDDAKIDIKVIEPLKIKRVNGYKRISLKIPADILTDGDYVLKLSGAAGQGPYEEVDNYYFRVVRQ